MDEWMDGWTYMQRNYDDFSDFGDIATILILLFDVTALKNDLSCL
jgi:hypothetical protein